MKKPKQIKGHIKCLEQNWPQDKPLNLWPYEKTKYIKGHIVKPDKNMT